MTFMAATAAAAAVLAAGAVMATDTLPSPDAQRRKVRGLNAQTVDALSGNGQHPISGDGDRRRPPARRIGPRGPGRPRLTLSQYDQVGAEVNGTLNTTLLAARAAATNANTVSFLLWDTDGHQYLDFVRFLHDQTTRGGNSGNGAEAGSLDVWVTLIPPSETLPVPVAAAALASPADRGNDGIAGSFSARGRREGGGPSRRTRHSNHQHTSLLATPPPSCAACPASHPHPYGDGFCCPGASDGEHCPSGGECCLTPHPPPIGCEGVTRCGTNPANKPACPPPPPPLPPSNRPARCSVPADSPLTPWNESALVDPTKGWHGCNDYAGWGDILGRLATLFPAVRAVNIDDFSSNVQTGVFTPSLVARVREGLGRGGVALIPTHYYGSGPSGFVLDRFPWLRNATDGVLFYFRNDKGGQAECGTPNKAGDGTCHPPRAADGPRLPVATPPVATALRGVSPGNPPPCTSCCLSGANAELSLKNMGGEIADFASAMPAGHPLHVGLYFTAYSRCVEPSTAYDRGALVQALSNPAVAGATVYVFEAPRVDCRSAGAAADKGCVVREVFGNFSHGDGPQRI